MATRKPTEKRAPSKPSKRASSSAAARRTSRPAGEAERRRKKAVSRGAHELVVLTGLSGAGKLSALKAFEDLGYYSVDNLPLELVPRFADLVRGSRDFHRAAIGVDIREGGIERFPTILKEVRKVIPTKVVFLEASDEVLQRRFSETRRPHPLGRNDTVLKSIRAERRRIDPVRNVADVLLDTSRFNVHELRAHINEQFQRDEKDRSLLTSVTSFGFKNGVPIEADLVFDVRFLPNPHFVPEFRHRTGTEKPVADYVKGFPQTQEFLDRTTEMLLFLLPHYIKEGKSYLTVAFGCTGGQHRSVTIAEEIRKRLAEANYRTKIAHRDMPKPEA